LESAHAKVVDELRPVTLQQAGSGLDLHHYSAIHHKISSETDGFLGSITDLQFALRQGIATPTVEFDM
jgi:hypothetical protein